ncbi:MAG TPA: hypothetical protein VGK10_05305 [Prolixibacteraceae bacterium]
MHKSSKNHELINCGTRPKAEYNSCGLSEIILPSIIQVQSDGESMMRSN